MKFARRAEPREPRPRPAAEVLAREVSKPEQGMFTDEEWDELKCAVDVTVRAGDKIKRLSIMLLLNPGGRDEFPELQEDGEHSIWEQSKEDLYLGIQSPYHTRNMSGGLTQIHAQEPLTLHPRSLANPALYATATVWLDPTRHEWFEFDPRFKRCLMDVVRGEPKKEDYIDSESESGKLVDPLEPSNRAMLALKTAVIFPELQQDIAQQDKLWKTVKQTIQQWFDGGTFSIQAVDSLVALRLLAPQHAITVTPEIIQAVEKYIEQRKNAHDWYSFLDAKLLLAVLGDPEAHLAPNGQLVLHPKKADMCQSQSLPQRHHV